MVTLPPFGLVQVVSVQLAVMVAPLAVYLSLIHILAEGTNYAAANGLTADGWKFSITKAAAPT